MEIQEKEFAGLFNRMHPGFFERRHICEMPQCEIFHEMILDLQAFKPAIYNPQLEDGATFGPYQGDMAQLRHIVGQVDADWVKYFNGDEAIYCGYVGALPVSFCLIADYGTFRVGNRDIGFGGPGCVGTLPQFRNRGIGLSMVAQVTEMLRQRGYDYSYIHFTSEAPWYAKLGYRTILRWNSRGILRQ